MDCQVLILIQEGRTSSGTIIYHFTNKFSGHILDVPG